MTSTVRNSSPLQFQVIDRGRGRRDHTGRRKEMSFQAESLSSVASTADGEANRPAGDTSADLKHHIAVDIGGSTAVRRNSNRPLSSRGDETSIVRGKSESKTSEQPQTTIKKSDRRATPRHYLWIFFFAVVLIIFLCPDLDPLDSRNLSWAYQTLFRRHHPTDSCRGRRVYMYDLPPDFNVALGNESSCNNSLIKWMDLCPRFLNWGYGLELWNKHTSQPDDEFDRSHWHETDFFMLEVIFHERLQNYRCLTKEWSEADALFIPYYTGLKALAYLYEMPDLTLTYQKRKLFGMELIDWMEKNGGEQWKRHDGRDHFLIMGRTAWDFQMYTAWGTGFSALPYVANMTTLLLERDPELENEIAIPYPTAFHPRSSKELRSWIEKVKVAERTYLFSYVGSPRSDSWSVRDTISSSCINAGESVCNLVNCTKVKCSHDPLPIYKSFLQSDFCLQPRGDSATRRSTFDCLISGAIPVFFHENSAYNQYAWHLPLDPGSYSVYIGEDDIRGGVSIQDILMSYSPDRISEMRRTIVGIIPNLLYNAYDNDPWSPIKDAFELSIDRVLQRIAAAKSGQ